MILIRDYLYSWHEDLYSEHFTNQDCLECFEEVLNMSIRDLDIYIVNSNSHKQAFHGALHEYIYQTDYKGR